MRDEVADRLYGLLSAALLSAELGLDGADAVNDAQDLRDQLTGFLRESGPAITHAPAGQWALSAARACATFVAGGWRDAAAGRPDQYAAARDTWLRQITAARDAINDG